MLFADMRCN